MLKETLTFHLSMLHKEADGLYHVYPCDAAGILLVDQGFDHRSSALRATLILIHESERLGVDGGARTLERRSGPPAVSSGG